MLFHDHAITAYHLTLEALRNFERIDAVGPGPYTLPAILFWFAATESYISTLYKITSALQLSLDAAQWVAPGTQLAVASKVVDKFSAVDAFFTGRRRPELNITRLHEFASFRNCVLHDLTEATPRRQYAHTLFAPRAEKANQLDAIEAMRVGLEVFDYFRYIFRSCDLMPDVLLEHSYERLDILADAVVYPAFAQILHDKGLSTHMPLGSPAPARCPVEALVDVELLISTLGPTAGSETSSESLVDAISARIVEAARPPENKFGIPNYTRRPRDA
jgi:hypothetical protein